MKSSTSEARRPAMCMPAMSAVVLMTAGMRADPVGLRQGCGVAYNNRLPRLAPGRRDGFTVSDPLGSKWESRTAKPRCRLDFPTLRGAGPNLGRSSNVRHHASNAGGGCPFWTPDPLLEPEDGSLHLRPSQSHPHHQPGAHAREFP